MLLNFFFFFFFQAEDGIRDKLVTGVQTCALPILIPMAALAGILVVVAYSMSEWRTFLAEFRAPKSDVAVLLTTFLLTVQWDLKVAIEVGMVLAAFLFMRRMAEVTNISALTHEFQDPVDGFERDPN